MYHREYTHIRQLIADYDIWARNPRSVPREFRAYYKHRGVLRSFRRSGHTRGAEIRRRLHDRKTGDLEVLEYGKNVAKLFRAAQNGQAATLSVGTFKL